MPQSVTQTLVLFLLMAAGFAAGKLGFLEGSNRRALSRLLVNFILPALIVASMQKPLSPELRSEAFAALGLSFVIYAAAFPLAMLFARLIRARGSEAGVHAFACVFSNVAFMGFPVMEALFGKESLFTVSIYNIPFQILAFSIGASMIARSGKERKGLKPADFVTPAGISSFVGFALFLLGIGLPTPLLKAMTLLGDTTTPLSMLLIGATLAATNPAALLRSPRLYLTSLYRLLLFPLGLYAVLSALGFSGRLLGMPVIIASMPVAANASILAEAYGGDSETASALVFVSTALSLLTLPLLAGGLFGI
ncbi:MAG: AEC family transporter [Spirochaetaceae bacterium]|nr:AEC family transporter [Spirochaetaceae bacterium]